MRFFSLAVMRVLVVVALTLPLFSHAAERALTLPEAQRNAVERSRQLAAQDASILSSKEMAVAAGQLPDPVLRLGIDNLPVEGPERFSLSRDFMTMRRIGVMQEFTSAAKRKLRSARFERETDRALAQKNAALAAIQRDTAIAWLETLYLERLRAAGVRYRSGGFLQQETLFGNRQVDAAAGDLPRDAVVVARGIEPEQAQPEQAGVVERHGGADRKPAALRGERACGRRLRCRRSRSGARDCPAWACWRRASAARACCSGRR